jgi:hypothetical protein
LAPEFLNEWPQKIKGPLRVCPQRPLVLRRGADQFLA